MTRIHLLLLWLCACNSLFAQFSFDFNQVGLLSDLGWQGDTEHFVIHDGKLKIEAPEAGSSFVHVKTNLPDSMEIGISFNMEFSPSNNNKLRIYLHIDTFDLEIASGYFIEIGENGSEDKMKLVRLIGGQALTIAEGSPALFSAEPVEASIKVLKNENGFWQFFVRTAESSFFQLELELFDSTIEQYFDQYFGIECIYTSTRKDKFYFDDCYLGSIVRDTIAPKVKHLKVLDNHSIKITFDEMLEPNTARDRSNYLWLNNSENPLDVAFNEFKPNVVLLHFAAAFEGQEIHELQVKNLKDLEGNRMILPEELTFYLAEQAEVGDLVINELLFNPFEGGEDFVELYNASSKILGMNGIEISNSKKENEAHIISQNFDLFPEEYLVLSSDSSALSFYQLPQELSFIKMDLPSLNNDEGNISLYIQGSLINSFDYDESMHFPLIDDPEGISLERISPSAESNSAQNWQSASALSGGATPGYRNSQHYELPIQIDTFFRIKESIVSPDNDGFQDVLVIQYLLPGEGYVGSVQVFDVFGNFVKNIINNQLLGTSGLLTWDGLDAANAMVPLGPYLILCSLFNAEGKIIKQKLHCYVAGNR